jgi:hypothetical protein
MSGYSRNAIVDQGRVGDVQPIQKPISLQDLSARVRDTLEPAASAGLNSGSLSELVFPCEIPLNFAPESKFFRHSRTALFPD